MSGGHLCEAEAPTEATAETLLLPLQNEDIITEIWLLSKDKFDRAASTNTADVVSYVRPHNPLPPNKKPTLLGWFLFGGRGWIRTTEAESSRFTVCPLWPLGNSPKYLVGFFKQGLL